MDLVVVFGIVIYSVINLLTGYVIVNRIPDYFPEFPKFVLVVLWIPIVLWIEYKKVLKRT